MSAADRILGFTVPGRNARGRIARMGAPLREVLAAHDYPDPLARLLGEALMLTAMLGATLREEEGTVTLQAQAQGGPVNLLVCDWVQGKVRGYLRPDPDHLGEMREGASLQETFGEGYLAITLEQTAAAERYQGIVPLEGDTLCHAVEGYFTTSEQIPTLIRVGLERGAEGWVAGGMLVQYLPKGEVGGPRLFTQDEYHDWEHVRILAGTATPAELVDTSLPLEDLLWRLFNEDEIRVTPPVELQRYCRCSAEHFRTVLARFSEEERAEMRDEQGRINVECEFCSSTYAIEV